ncbi:MAG: tetratricopeptide repeat protein [Elusimicrobiota bacterium]
MGKKRKKSAELKAVERKLMARGVFGTAAYLPDVLNLDQRLYLGYTIPHGQQYDLGRYDAELEVLNRLIKRSPNDARPFALRGRIRRHLMRKHDALADLDRAVELDPEDAQSYGWRGELLLALGRFNLGMQDLENARNLDPKWVWPYIWAAIGWLLRNEIEPSLELLDKALRIDPDCGLALILRGRVRLQQKKPQEAYPDLKRATELDPKCIAAHGCKGVALAAMGDTEGAVAAFTDATYLEPDAKTFHDILISHDGLLENSRESLEKLNAYIKKHPKAAWAYTLRGDLIRNARFGRYEDGIKDHLKATSLEPHKSWLWACLARARIQYFYVKEGLKDMEKACEIDPECPWLLMWLGESRRRDGQFRAAIKDFNDTIKMQPDLPMVWLWRGRIHNEKGRYHLAIKDFDQAIRLDPAYGYAYAKRGESLMNLERYHEAVREFDWALNTRLPNNHEWVFGMRARARYETGDYLGMFEDISRTLKRDIKLCWFPLEYTASVEDPKCWEIHQTISEALAQDSNATWLYGWRGAVKLALNKPLEGAADLSLAIQCAPTFAWPHAWRGRLYWQTGRMKEAERDLKEAARLDPTCSWIHGWLAELYVTCGAFRQAVDEATTALQLWPKLVDAYYVRGEALRCLKRYDEAKLDLGRAIAMNHHHKLAFVSRAILHGETGDHQAQIQDFRRLAQFAPEMLRKTLDQLEVIGGNARVKVTLEQILMQGSVATPPGFGGREQAGQPPRGGRV